MRFRRVLFLTVAVLAIGGGIWVYQQTPQKRFEALADALQSRDLVACESLCTTNGMWIVQKLFGESNDDIQPPPAEASVLRLHPNEMRFRVTWHSQSVTMLGAVISKGDTVMDYIFVRRQILGLPAGLWNFDEVYVLKYAGATYDVTVTDLIRHKVSTTLHVMGQNPDFVLKWSLRGFKLGWRLAGGTSLATP